MDSEFPTEVYERGGQLYRKVKKSSGDGGEWEQERPVARTLDEAKVLRQDFFHPTLGWILSGYKLEKDRNTDDIIADGSHGEPLSIEEQERRAVAITHS